MPRDWPLGHIAAVVVELHDGSFDRLGMCRDCACHHQNWYCEYLRSYTSADFFCARWKRGESKDDNA